MNKADLWRPTVLVATLLAGATLASPAGAQFAASRAAFAAYEHQELVQQVQFRDFFRPFWNQGGGWGGGGWGGGGYQQRRSYDPYNPFNQRPPQQQTYESLKPPAPAARKPDTPPVTESVVVIGDTFAEWLAYGLEQTFADSPQVGVVRKIRPYSGLVRYEARADAPDWSQAVKETLAGDKPAAIVVMLGLNDRLPLRDKPAAAESGAPANAGNEGARKPAAPPPPPANYEFHTEQWGELYAKRIDEMIAALKSKGAPVIWVGLPSIRGAKATADMQFLNELYRARAEKAGIIYVDIWDGFVDERGNFAQQGPDFQGQTRRLRTYDGVNFTAIGAEKLGHYVDHELRRVLANHAVPVALPGPEEQSPAKGGTASAKPAIGPVVPLSAVGGGEGGELLGTGAPAQKEADPLATRVLGRGEALNAPPGRADDFAWPRTGDSSDDATEAAPAPPEPAAPAAAPTGPAGKNETNKGDTNKTEAKKPNEAKKEPAAAAAAPAKPRQPRFELDGAPPRPPLPVGPAAGR